MIGDPATPRFPREPVLVEEYLLRVQSRLIDGSEDAWLVYIETHITYEADGDGTVKRKGGTFLHSRAHGAIAELTIRNEAGDEIITFIEPNGNQTWTIAKILIEALTRPDVGA